MSYLQWIIVVLTIGAAHPRQQAAANCVKFSSPDRLREGTAFTAPIAPDLELRLRSDGAGGWDVTVGPRGEAAADYLWVVSPPLRTAPHRTIGAAYGLTARQSARIDRRLRFVLTAADYERALTVVESEQAGDAKLAKLDALGKGTVRLKITDFRIRDHVKTASGAETDGFDWIRFEGETCVPR